MLLDKRHGMLIEVFAKTSKSKAFDRSVVESGRLFQPLVLSGGKESLKSWRWTVVRSDPSYIRPDEPLELVSPHPSGDCWCAVDLERKILRIVSSEERKTMISGHLWSPKNVEDHIEETLARVIN